MGVFSCRNRRPLPTCLTYQLAHPHFSRYAFSTRPVVNDAAPFMRQKEKTEHLFPATEDAGDCTTEVVEEMRLALDATERRVVECQDKIKELQDKLLRALAENENGRQRHEKAVFE